MEMKNMNYYSNNYKKFDVFSMKELFYILARKGIIL
jgi:hypothetical protein